MWAGVWLDECISSLIDVALLEMYLLYGLLSLADINDQMIAPSEIDTLCPTVSSINDHHHTRYIPS